MASDYPLIAREELFAKLAQGHAARVTVVTPNKRLYESVSRAFDESQSAGGLVAWESADILPLDGFIERLWEDALYSDRTGEVALLLTPAQEQALWEDAIGGSRHAGELLSMAAAAAGCREAWQLAHAWRLHARMKRAEGNEDVQAFLDWSQRYERATAARRQTDRARLADVVAALLANGALRKPRTLVLYGFDIAAPQAEDFLAALAANGVEVLRSRAPSRRARVTRVELASARDEIAAAARWARARLEARAHARIGIVVPDLAKSRAAVRRIVADVMQPRHLVPGSSNAVLPFDISIGVALGEYPLVHDALLALRLAGREIAFEDASRLIRSPFLAGARDEMAARVRLDAALRKRAGVTLNLDQLLRLLALPGTPRAAILAQRLASLAEFRKAHLFGARPASEWGKALSEALRVVGFPGERTLDSTEYQTLGKWHEVLAGFAALERVTGKMGYREACAKLARMTADTLFQPETPQVPIAILGVLESAGLEFDHLWVMGLTDDAWPLAARPNPFIPVRLQREAGVPQADAALSLALDRRITQGWFASAGEVIVSHARMRDDAQLSPSPLIAALPPGAEPADIPAYDSLRDAIHRTRRIEHIEDANAPAFERGSHEGGTELFRDQAACPFRAFARHRLGSGGIPSPQPGLDAMDRGTLLHVTLAEAWKELKDKATLDSIEESELRALLERGADEAIATVRRRRPDVLAGRLGVIERERLVSHARAWLEVERQREDFEVVAVERKNAVTFGGVTVNGTLDRMDRLAQGGHAILDYKTGQVVVSRWLGARPDEPQMPMYAMASEENVVAIAFAKLKPGDFRFEGLAAAEGLLPKVKTIDANMSPLAARYADWAALREGWRGELDALGRGFASGDARVDPKSLENSCKHCDQQLFCRIAEKTPDPLDDEIPADDE